MSKNYELRAGDDIRRLAFTLQSNRRALTEEPTSAVLKITVGSGTEERDLTLSGGEWVYDFTDDDFIDLVAGTYQAKIYATWSNGKNGTFPTKGAITIVVYAA